VLSTVWGIAVKAGGELVTVDVGTALLICEFEGLLCTPTALSEDCAFGDVTGEAPPSALEVREDDAPVMPAVVSGFEDLCSLDDLARSAAVVAAEFFACSGDLSGFDLLPEEFDDTSGEVAPPGELTTTSSLLFARWSTRAFEPG